MRVTGNPAAQPPRPAPWPAALLMYLKRVFFFKKRQPKNNSKCLPLLVFIQICLKNAVANCTRKVNFGVGMLALKAEVRRGSAGGSRPAPGRARQKQRRGNRGRGRGSLPGASSPLCFAPSARASLGVTSPQASRDRDRPQHSPLPSRALLSTMLPRGGRAGAPHVSSSAEAAATDSYCGKSLHSCAKQSLCPTASRISHDLLPNTANASVRLHD